MNRDKATEIINNCFRDIIKHQIKAHVEVYRDTIRDCYGTIGLEVLEEVSHG